MTTCEHGNLKRQCLICELMAENATLSAEKDALQGALCRAREFRFEAERLKMIIPLPEWFLAAMDKSISLIEGEK